MVELNNKENIIHQNLKNVVQIFLREEFLNLNSYVF